MKKQYNLIIISIFCLAISFSSCKKIKDVKCNEIVNCTLNESPISTSNSYQDYNNWQSTGVERHIIEDIVIDSTCNCIVSGYVKYLKDGKTVALIKYGDGTCDAWAIKINCIDGSCSEKSGAYCTKFEQNCDLQENTDAF